MLREVVQHPGPIKLVVAKCWDSAPTSTGGGGTNSKNYFTIPRAEPVRPIDPGAWVAHTAAVRGERKKDSHFLYLQNHLTGRGRDFRIQTWIIAMD